MKFRLIPPGEFLMVSTPEFAATLKGVSPDDMMILTQPIYLGVNEVTQAEYEKVMGVNPSHFAPMGMGKESVAGLNTTEHPVEMVSWNDAAEFCAKLSQQEKLNPFYLRAGETITPLDGTGYRLASEAEWEFACRAGTPTKYWIGDKAEDLVRAGWFRGNSGGRTHAAGELKANPFALADIHGNVWEWVQDGWDASFDGKSHDKPAINPNVPFYDCSQRMLRGGHWEDSASNCRSSNRITNVPTNRNLNLGFRVSLVADAVKKLLSEKLERLNVADIVGEYEHYNETPISDWHRGNISMEKDKAGRDVLRWTNAAGVSWQLNPDLPNGVLNTGPDNPYIDIRAYRVFSLVLSRDGIGEYLPQVRSFKFGNMEFVRKSDGATVPDPQPAPTTLDRAVSFVESLGGKVFRDDNSPFTPVTRIELAGTKVTDAGLKELASLTSLELLDLSNTQVTDAGIEELQKAMPKCQIVK